MRIKKLATTPLGEKEMVNSWGKRVFKGESHALLSFLKEIQFPNPNLKDV